MVGCVCMLTEIIAGAACVCIIILVYSYFLMQPKQRELTERARLYAMKNSGQSPSSGGDFDFASLLNNPIVQQALQGLLQKKE